MSAHLEIKDGNRGNKKPTLPIKHVDTIIDTKDVCVYVTMVWEDALGEKYTSRESHFYFDLKLVTESDTSEP